MKNLIIIIGTILLGIFIFQMIAGDGPDSLKYVTRNMMLYNIAEYGKLGEDMY